MQAGGFSVLLIFLYKFFFHKQILGGRWDYLPNITENPDFDRLFVFVKHNIFKLLPSVVIKDKNVQSQKTAIKLKCLMFIFQLNHLMNISSDQNNQVVNNYWDFKLLMPV